MSKKELKSFRMLMHNLEYERSKESNYEPLDLSKEKLKMLWREMENRAKKLNDKLSENS